MDKLKFVFIIILFLSLSPGDILNRKAIANGLPQAHQVGEEVYDMYETPHPYEGSGIVWKQTFSSLNAGYISIHFAGFDLADGDYIEISSPDGKYQYTYTGKGKKVRGGKETLSNFWARHIPGETAIVTLYSNGSNGAWGFIIDKWARGYPSETINDQTIEGSEFPEAICGSDDKVWAPCYTGTSVYQKSRAVARLLINGVSVCTGWLLGNEGHLLTNNHCINTQFDANNTDYEFMAEGATCGTNCSGWFSCPGTVEASSGILVRTNTSLDYSLILLPVNLTANYGYLQFRSGLPSIDEQIYIPQHPGGKGKQITFFDDQSLGSCRIFSTDQTPCFGGPGDIAYFCDTEGGSSGSPVIAQTDNLVVALHHCANCPNRGVPIPSIISNMGPFLPSDAIGGTSGSSIKGTIALNDAPVAFRLVVLSQLDEPLRWAITDINGNYEFPAAVSGKRFTIIILGPTVP